MNRKVWVLGSSNIDVTYRVKEIPRKGYTIQAQSCVTGTGGKGANQAVAAAHWGAEVKMIGAVGEDINGQTLINALKSQKVNTDNVSVIKGVLSGNATILVDDNGANCITVFPGANQHVPIDANPGFCEGDLLISQFEVNMDALEFYFSEAKKSGVYTILNPSPYKCLSERLLKMTDMIVANESEAFEIGRVEVDSVAAARTCGMEILKSGPGTVVITLGKLGAVAVTGEKTVHIPEYPVKVVDTQGAGDAFLGSLAAKLCEGVSLEEACMFANTVASISVSRRGGTQVSLCSVKETEDMDLAKIIQVNSYSKS